jgi:hypothetical protein
VVVPDPEDGPDSGAPCQVDELRNSCRVFGLLARLKMGVTLLLVAVVFS